MIVTGGEVEVRTTVLLPVLMSWNALWYSGAAGDPVDGGVDEAERVADLLVGQGDPARRAAAVPGHHRGRADQPAETGAVLIAASASTIELCEQSFTDTLVCGLPGPSCLIAATACADSVPSGPGWPRAKMAAPACS